MILAETLSMSFTVITRNFFEPLLDLDNFIKKLGGCIHNFSTICTTKTGKKSSTSIYFMPEKANYYCHQQQPLQSPLKCVKVPKTGSAVSYRLPFMYLPRGLMTRGLLRTYSALQYMTLYFFSCTLLPRHRTHNGYLS